MIFIGGLFLFLFVIIIQTLFHHENHHRIKSTEGNVTLTDLISSSVIKSWSSEPLSQLLELQPEALQFSLQRKANDTPLSLKKELSHHSLHNVLNKSNASSEDEQSDDPFPLFSENDLIDKIFEVPNAEITPDWATVLGTFQHYDDENWSEFLTKSEFPFIVRMFLEQSSEVVAIKRTDNQKSKENKGSKIVNEVPMSIVTTSWLLTHSSKFSLKKTYYEYDIDGTNSQNTFFFVSPRLLIHNKIKEKWRTSIIRHFDDKGLNMTIIDRDRMTAARRFFNRI